MLPEAEEIFARVGAVADTPRADQHDALTAALEGVPLYRGLGPFGLRHTPLPEPSHVAVLIDRFAVTDVWAVRSATPTLSDVRRLAGSTLREEPRSPPDRWVAALRLWVAVGHDPGTLWKHFEAEANREGIGLDELESVEPWPHEHRVRSVGELPRDLAEVSALLFDVQW